MAKTNFNMSRILVLAPHPDDEAIGCGGTLLHHARQCDEVHVVFLTSGEKGGHGRSEAETIRVREAEAHAAGKILGVSKIEFWHLPDGAVRPTLAAIERLQKKLKQFKPDKIYVTHDREMHPDHRGAVRLLESSLQAVRRTRHAKTWTPTVLGYEVWTPIQKLSEIVDISPFLEKKLRAVKTYRSQCAVVGFVEAVRGLNRYRGEMHSWPGGDYAEVFTRLKI
jgi:LmbE family N-acetylglucosaminyl deacetylase